MNDRYQRHRALMNFGDAAQDKLEAASVLVVGAGGLGVPVLQYLNAMGVGRIGIADADTVALSNLHRQPLYTEDDLGKSKAEVMGNFLIRQNSGTTKEVHNVFLQPDNALEIISGYDLVVDASDNFATRYLVNDACVILNKPFVYGGLYGYEGQVSVFNYNNGPTYRCLYPDMTDGVIADCNTNGVLGVVPGIIGDLQAMEAVKVITGVGAVTSGTLLLFDTLNLRMHKMHITPKPENKKITHLRTSYGDLSCHALPVVGPEELYRDPEKFFLLDVRTRSEYEDYHMPGSCNIPLSELEERRNEVPEDKDICLICKQAIRTRSAAVILEHLRAQLWELEGGLDKHPEYVSKTGAGNMAGK